MDDETDDVDDEEYDRINKEMYDDVNVELKDAEPADEGKAITTAAPAQVASFSRYVSSNYEATTSTPAITESTTLSAIHQRVFDLEKEVKILRNVYHNLAIYATINSEVPIVVKECLETNLEDSLHKVIQKKTDDFVHEHTVRASTVTYVLKQQQQPQKRTINICNIKMEQPGKQQEIKYTITSSDKASLKEFDQKRTLFETMTITKSFDKNPKHRAIYHALMESILEDEEAMDKGVVDKLKKRNPDNADREEDLPTGSDQWLKRRTTSKDVELSKKENDLAKAEKPSKTFNDLMTTPIDFTAFAINHLQISDLTKANLEEASIEIYTTSLTNTKAAKYDLKGIEDMVPTLWSPIKVVYDKHALLGTSYWKFKRQTFYGYASNKVSKHDVYSTKRILAVTIVKVNKWYGYGHLEEIEVRRAYQQLYNFMEGDFLRLHLNDIKDMFLLIVQNKLINLKSDIIVDLAAALRIFTRRIVIQKRVGDL
ncbi:hypothetical protein Tco_1403600 [Tanacetum coccineum]